MQHNILVKDAFLSLFFKLNDSSVDNQVHLHSQGASQEYNHPTSHNPPKFTTKKDKGRAHQNITRRRQQTPLHPPQSSRPLLNQVPIFLLRGA